MVSNRVRWSLAALLIVVGVPSLWWILTPNEKPARAPDRVTQRREAPAPAAVPDRPPRPSEAPPAPTSAPMPSLVPSASLPVVGPGPHDPHEPGMVPHPLDEARARIAAENQLLQALNDAMSFRKVKEMREMLAEYRKLDPTDIDAHQLGYEVIADCIEFPGDASLTAAREFYDTQRHSPLRRFVRRICFENSN